MHPGGLAAGGGSLSGKERLDEILQTAIGLEHKSILFYIGLLDLVPNELGKGKVSGIIEEEKSHVAVLTRQLNALRE
jgi:rubrerythrin